LRTVRQVASLAAAKKGAAKRTPAPEIARAVELASKPTPGPARRCSSAATRTAARAGTKGQDIQVNFLVTEPTARLISQLAAKEGSDAATIRKNCFKESGHSVPDADLNPPGTKKRRFAQP
jgi:hypothetical protein